MSFLQWDVNLLSLFGFFGVQLVFEINKVLTSRGVTFLPVDPGAREPASGKYGSRIYDKKKIIPQSPDFSFDLAHAIQSTTLDLCRYKLYPTHKKNCSRCKVITNAVIEQRRQDKSMNQRGGGKKKDNYWTMYVIDASTGRVISKERTGM